MNPQSSLGEHFLHSAIAAFHAQKNLADAAIRQLDDQQLHQPLDENTNSVAFIIKHLAGNMLSRWTDFLIPDGEKPSRDRDPEFIDDIPARHQLMARWEQGWKCLFTALAALRPADLTERVTIRGHNTMAAKRISTRRSRSTANTLIAVLAFLTPPALALELQTATEPQVVEIQFQTENGWQYDGRIELPPQGQRRPWAVMLIGGGMGTAIDWGVPAIMTLNGNPTRDADTIARALLDRGFVVVRWRAVRRNDPLWDEEELMMEPPSFAQTIEQAHKAMAAFRAKSLVPKDNIFLVGHSLGALRAALLIAANSDLPGLVMLAGASLIPSDLNAVRECVGKARADFDRKQPGNSHHNTRHEYILSSLAAQRDKWEKPVAGTQTKRRTTWPADVLTTTKTPTLLLVGSLDERWLLESYVFTDYMRRQNHPDYEWLVFQDLGHQLGPEKPAEVYHQKYGVIAKTKTGPIDDSVVNKLVNWIDQRAN